MNNMIVFTTEDDMDVFINMDLVQTMIVWDAAKGQPDSPQHKITLRFNDGALITYEGYNAYALMLAISGDDPDEQEQCENCSAVGAVWYDQCFWSKFGAFLCTECKAQCDQEQFDFHAGEAEQEQGDAT